MPVMPESGEPASAVDKNTKEQYEELGRFIVAFEDMVNDVRELCIFILGRFDFKQQTFVSVALHHENMTAKPLFEIMRSLISEVTKDEASRKLYKMDNDSVAIISGVLGTINNEYMDLAKIRNGLLHGTWYMGFTGPEDLDARKFDVHKFKIKATGLEKFELPKTAGELHSLTKRCGDVRYWILAITSCFLLHDGAEPSKEEIPL